MSKKTLIVFTRYPELGKTKTRLIRAIGAKKATNLQRKMTEETLKKVEKITENINIQIYYTGGNLSLMEDWLGKKWSFVEQIQADLGQKMYGALEANYNQQKKPVIIIGIDCPFLDTNILQEALTAIDHNDMVIGKAEDGGYYLIGLKQPIKELFTGISWSTDQVYSQTIKIAYQFNLSVYNLPILRDIDRPEDLAFYT